MYSYKPVPVEYEVPCDDNASEICYDKLQSVKDLSFSHTSACAVTFDGYVYCWGENQDGEGGQGEEIRPDGSNSVLNVARRVVNTADRQNVDPYLNNIKQVVHGQKFACALSNEGDVFCWGINGAQQLGGKYEDQVYETPWQSDDGNRTLGEYDIMGKPIVEARKYSPTPLKVAFPKEVAKVNKLFVGYDITCATVERNDSDPHNVYCWGNDLNLLITGNTNNNLIYQKDAFDAGYMVETVDHYNGVVNEFYVVESDGIEDYELSNKEKSCLDISGKSVSLLYCENSGRKFYVEYGLPGNFVDNIGYCVFDQKIENRDGVFRPAVLRSDLERCTNKTFQTRRFYSPYLIQKSQNTRVIYSLPFSSVGVTNHPIFENVTELSIEHRNYASRICAVTANNTNSTKNKVLCLTPYSGVNDSYKIVNESFVVDINGEELSDVSKMISMEKTTFLLTAQGLLYSLGSNEYGLLGISQDDKNYTPSQDNDVNNVASQVNLKNVVSVSGNKRSVCVSVKNTSLNYQAKCWGSSMYGQTGYPTGDDYSWQWINTNNKFEEIFNNSDTYVSKPTEMGEGFIFDNPKE